MKPDYVQIAASKVPAVLRKEILEKGLIDKANTLFEYNTPMEYLFDVYEEFVDVAGEHDDFSCGQCRAHVLAQWQKMKPYLITMQNEADGALQSSGVKAGE